jgi:putative transposase
MGRKRHTEEQIISILKEADTGMKTSEICRKYSISDATFYKWKAKFGGMDISEARRLKTLEDENRKLKRIVADQALDILAYKEIAKGNF